VVTLRPYQITALDGLRRNIAAGVRAQVLMMATGAGKTSVASVLAGGSVAKGNRVCFVADSIELVDQALARFAGDGLSCGVIQGAHYLTDYSRPVQIATIQTLARRWPEMPEDIRPRVVVIDECHVLHKAHEQVISDVTSSGGVVVGLSATPFRRGMGKVFDAMVVGATTAQLTRDGYLVPAKCYAPYVPDLRGVKTTTGGDWQADALAEFMGDAKLVGDVVDHWQRHASDRQTICFAANVAHSRHLCDAFVRKGIAAAHLDGYERDPEARQKIIDDYRAGRIQVLTNCAILSKGFDAPATSCIVVARPTKSLMLHLQMLGRGLRTAEGKQDCLILDHAGNVLRNGLPTDPLPTELHDGSLGHNPDRRVRDKREPVESACASCGHVSTKHVCPACGFKPERREGVEVRDGELFEVAETQERFGADELAGLYAEMLGHARAKGYADGWAWHKVREYAGRAPKATKSIQPREPSERTRKIIQHLNIKRAKRRAA